MAVDHIERIRVVGRRLQWAVRAVLAMTLISVIGLIAWRGPLALLRIPPGVEVIVEGLSLAAKASSVALGLLVTGCYLWVLWALHRLFGLYARGIVFSHETASAVRQVGIGLLTIDPMRILVSALTGPVLTLARTTQPFFNVDVQVSMLVAGLFVVAIGGVLSLAQELHDADQLTI